MADDSKLATVRSNLSGGNVKATRVGVNVVDATVEVAAAADAGSVYKFVKVPTSARIHGFSAFAWDDLASTGSPTLDVGFLKTDAVTTTDDNALLDGLDVTAAASTAVSLINDPADWGKRVWEIGGYSADPESFVWITATLKDAAANTGGSLAMSLAYSVD